MQNQPQGNTKAVAIRNNANKQLFDVLVIDYETPALSQVILEGVQFEVASQYVEDYNSSGNIN